MTCSYSELLYSHANKQIGALLDNLDESYKHNTERNKAETNVYSMIQLKCKIRLKLWFFRDIYIHRKSKAKQ